MMQDFINARYDSIADFLSAVELPCRVFANETIKQHFLGSDHGADWYGANCNSGREVLTRMREGWKEGRDRLNELRSKLGTIEVAPVDMRRRPIRMDRGDNLDMQAVYAGRFDICWRTARRQSTNGPQRVDIVANMICSGAEHFDVLFWRGAAAAVLADILETAGYMVRMVVNFGGNAEDKKCSCRITVKDHGAPFDVTSTSAVILPGFFRALGHAWIANHCPHKRQMGGISVGQGIVDDGELLVTHKVRDHGTALAFVNEQIAKINSGNQTVAA